MYGFVIILISIIEFTKNTSLETKNIAMYFENWKIKNGKIIPNCSLAMHK